MVIGAGCAGTQVLGSPNCDHAEAHRNKHMLLEANHGVIVAWVSNEDGNRCCGSGDPSPRSMSLRLS